MAHILITHSSINSGNPVFIVSKGLTISYKKNNDGKPNANYNGDTVPRRRSGSIDVPTYALQATLDNKVTTIGGRTVLTQELLKDFLALENDDSDPITLNIQYGTSTQWKSLQKISGARVDEIPVTLASVTVSISTGESRDGYLPSFTIAFEEVRKVS